MPIPSSVPWGGRLREVFGAALTEVGHEQIEALVTSAAREAPDLDFKGPLYGNTDADKRELCKDIAAMRNDRGGVIVLGVEDEDGTAFATPGVELSDAEERRMHQIVAGGTAPHAAFEIHRIDGLDEGRGYYLLIAPPSSQRPHAVMVGDGFRYPRRDGSTTRYMSEVEVADMYRSRFGGEADQVDRLRRISQDMWSGLAIENRPWLVIGLAPNDPGVLPMSFAERTAVELWVNERHRTGPGAVFAGTQALVSVKGKRYSARSTFDQRGAEAHYQYAEFHNDGAVGAAVYASPGDAHDDQPAIVPIEGLVWTVLGQLRLLGEAAERAGVYGDVAILAQLEGAPMRAGFFQYGMVELNEQSLQIASTESRHTVPLEAIATLSHESLRVARLILQDIVNAFGIAEIRQLAPDGSLRLRYFTGRDMEQLAEQFNLPTATDDVAT